MQNIPVFTTQNGVGSLILREIPYSQTAYIKIQSTQSPATFIEECVSFCKAVGAEAIYAAGHDFLEQFPFHTAIWQMTRDRNNLEESQAYLFPVTEKTVNRWLELYNGKMKNVPNAAHMTFLDGKKLLSDGNGYFVHREGILLGIGMAAGEKIDLVTSFQPGAGKEVVLALNGALSGKRIVLEVASINQKAVRLYESLGFVKSAELRKWYKLL